jgi:hypothetical protein
MVCHFPYGFDDDQDGSEVPSEFPTFSAFYENPSSEVFEFRGGRRWKYHCVS